MKKFIAVVLIILGFAGVSHAHTEQNKFVSEPATSNQASTTTSTVPPEQEATQPITTDSTSETSQTAPSNNAGMNDSNLSNDNTYTNVDGNTVHSPAYSTDSSIPEGATAKCVDGTFSFSQHHSGSCSYHGGVSDWL